MKTTHAKYPSTGYFVVQVQQDTTYPTGRGAVSQRTETEPSNQAGQREYGPQEHDEGLGLEQSLLPGPLPVNRHSPATGIPRTLN